MTTEEEETETLELLDVARQPREVKRRRENDAAAAAEAKGATSVFFERSWRRHAAESLTDVHAAVDALGRPPPPPPPEPPLPEGLTREEMTMITHHLGGPTSRISVAQRSERAVLVEADGRLLRVRGNEVREMSEVGAPPESEAAPPAAPAPPPSTPSEVPESAVAAAAPPPPVPEPGPPAAPEPAPAAPAEPEKKGLRGKLPFGKKKK